MVLTIERVSTLSNSAGRGEGQFSKHFNWKKLNALEAVWRHPYEDNVVIHENGVENMTRDLKLA